MKKAFLLLEVLISIMLIFGVVFTLFQIKENNFLLFERMSKNSFSNSAISIVALNNNEVSNENRTIYVQDIITDPKEDFKEIFKGMKLRLTEEQVENKNLDLPNKSIELKVMKTQLNLDERFNKSYYTIKLQ